MSKDTQLKQNLILVEKLNRYLLEHDDASVRFPEDSSYVVFSADNNELNKLNKSMLTKLLQEGKSVVKAEETKNNKQPWKLTFLTG